MSASRKGALAPVGLGVRAIRGGGVVVAVEITQREPRIALSAFLPTCAEGDRLSLEPYHVAAEMKRGPGGAPSPEAASAVAEGRKRQDQLAAKGLKELLTRLKAQGFEPAVTALLINRAGWVTDLLSYSLQFPEHPPVAEGLAVRDALRFAFGKTNLKAEEIDEKSLPDLAAQKLRLAPPAIEAHLKILGAAAGRPWRKEQKLACLAAWVALTQLA